MKQVHIVSLSPRSGTTLLMELMVHCFAFDGHADHELPLIFAPDPPVARFLSKNPALQCLKIARPMLNRRPDLWIICVIRDPRDIVVSRHNKLPGVFWTHLGIIRDRIGYYRAALRHDRFLTVHYENLVTDPDAVQRELLRSIHFLEKTDTFSCFHEIAAPTPRAIEALGGVRAISTSSVGLWKTELPRLKAQLERHGDFANFLIEHGYEKDGSWKSLLAGVTADNGKDRIEDQVKPTSRIYKLRLLKRWIYNRLFMWRAMLGFPQKRKIILCENAVKIR